MVSEKDIQKINSGKEKFKLIRKIRKCDETRLRYDHKSFIWDLELRSL
jgi:hypothetical protein